MKYRKCKNCGAKFYLSANKRYVSRDPQECGVTASLKSTEPKMYDTFDCPYCGCQIIVHERKYKVLEVKKNEKDS